MDDQVQRIRERERLRIEDRLRQLDRLEAAARTLVVEGKRRAGYTWDHPVEESRQTLIAAAALVGDADLATAVDELVRIDIPWEDGTASPVAELDAAFRRVVSRAAAVRRDSFGG